MAVVFNNILLMRLAVSVVFIALLYPRFSGLGLWPLADDEYHTVEAVRNILKHGLPVFECGGLYARGVLYQYLLAAAAVLFGDVEQVYRTVNAVISLLAIPAVYSISRLIMPRSAALLVLLLFSASIWQTEYARYVRMYTPFQVVFLWYIYAFLLFTYKNRPRAATYMLFLSFLSVFVYEAGIFLAALNFVALYIARGRYSNTNRYWLTVVVSVFVAVITYLYVSTDFTSLDIPNITAAETALGESVKTRGSMLNYPPMLLLVSQEHSMWFVLAAMAMVLLVMLLRRDLFPRGGHNALLSMLVILLIAANSYLAILVLMSVFLMLNLIKHEDMCRYLWAVFFLIASSFSLWLILLVANPDILYAAVGEGDFVRKLLRALFGYPDYYSIVSSWLSGQSAITLILLLTIGAGVLFVRDNISRSLFVIITIMASFVALTYQPYSNTRYTFFLYPLALILLVYYLNVFITRRFTSGLVVPALLLTGVTVFAASDDHQIGYLSTIDTYERNFRVGLSDGRRFHLRNKMDFASVSDYVNRHHKDGDLVIVSVRPVHHYLVPGIDYYFIPRYDKEYKNVAACGGERELWTNAKLVSSQSDLMAIVERSKGVVWLIMKSGRFPYPNRTERELSEVMYDQIVYQSADNNLVVYKIAYQ